MYNINFVPDHQVSYTDGVNDREKQTEDDRWQRSAIIMYLISENTIFAQPSAQHPNLLAKYQIFSTKMG